MRALCLAVLIALAGCASPPPSVSQDVAIVPPVPEDPVDWPVVHMHEGDDAALGVCPEAGGNTMIGASRAPSSFDMPAGANVTLVEASWDGAPTGVCVLLGSEDGVPRRLDCQATCVVDGGMRQEMPGLTEGEWMVHFGVDGAAVTGFKVAVSSFPDRVPEGYTAL